MTSPNYEISNDFAVEPAKARKKSISHVKENE
jgi:hypothetical protein